MNRKQIAPVFVIFSLLCFAFALGQPKPLFTFQGTFAPGQIEWSPDDKTFVSNNKGTITLWETRSGRLLTVMDDATGEYRKICFSSDGRYIAGVNQKGFLNIWSVSGLSLLYSINPGSNDKIHFKDVLLVPGASLLVLHALNTHELAVYDYKSGKQIRVFREHKSTVNSVNATQDGNIISTDNDGATFIWEAGSGKILHTYNFHNTDFGGISAKTVINGLGTLFCLLKNRRIGVFEVRTGKLLFSEEYPESEVYDASFLPGENKMVYDHQEGFFLLDLNNYTSKRLLSGSSIHQLPGNQYFAFNKKTKALFMTNSGQTVFYSFSTGETVDFALTDSEKEELKGWTFSNSGEFFYTQIIKSTTTEGLGQMTIHYAYSRCIGDGETLAPLHFYPAAHEPDHTGQSIIGFLSNSTLLLSDGSVFDYQKLNLPLEINGNDATVDDSRTWVMYKANGKRKNYWIPQRKNTALPLFSNPQAIAHGINDAVFSTNFRYAFTKRNLTGKLWDVRRNKVIFTFDRPNTFDSAGSKANGGINHVTFSPDSKMLLFQQSGIAVDSRQTASIVKVFDLDKKKIIFSKPMPPYLRGLRMSRDRRYLFVLKSIVDEASAYNNLVEAIPWFMIWDLATGQCLTKTSSYDGEFIDCRKRKSGKNALLFHNVKQTSLAIWQFEKGINSITAIPIGGNNPDKIPTILSYKLYGEENDELALTTSDNKTKILDVNTGKILRNFDFGGRLVDIFGKRLALLDGPTGYFVADLLTGNVLFYIFVTRSRDFIIRLENGYYFTSSKELLKNYSYAYKLNVLGFEQLDVRYNRPDKVLEAVGNEDASLLQSYQAAYRKRIKRLGLDTVPFREGYNVPVADFSNREQIRYEQKTGSLTLQLSFRDSMTTLDRFNVWVNDVPVFGMRGVAIRWREQRNFDTSINIRLSQGENRIETSALNSNGIESYHVPLFVKYSPALLRKDTVYFAGIGIDRFADSVHNLNYCSKDIRDLAIRLKEKYGGAIQIDTLFNENVTIEKVKALKRKLLQSKEDDKVVIAYSGHGLVSKDYDYYLSTYRTNFERPEEKSLPYDVLENLVDGITARKKLMLIDACHSGELDKEELQKMQTMRQKPQKEHRDTVRNKGIKRPASKGKRGLKNSFELMQELFVNVSRGTGTTIVAAATGTQFARERNDLENGIFTYAILELLKAEKTVRVSTLKKYVSTRVRELTKGLQEPTTRNETFGNDWTVW